MAGRVWEEADYRFRYNFRQMERPQYQCEGVICEKFAFTQQEIMLLTDSASEQSGTFESSSQISGSEDQAGQNNEADVVDRFSYLTDTDFSSDISDGKSLGGAVPCA